MARLQGAVVATAQCFGAAGQLPLAPVAEWLRHDAVQSAAANLDPAWRTEVGRLVPVGGGGISSRATANAWQRHRFLEGLARALIAVQRPLLVVLDNVQWCDQDTLAFITFWLGLADDARLLVAATLRQDDLDEDPELALDRPDAGYRAAHRGPSQPAGGRRHGASRSGHFRGASP